MTATNQTCRDTVETYISLLNDGTRTGADFVPLYAENGTIEDPVGSEVRSGAAAIEEFYNAIPSERSAVLNDLRVVAGEVVFSFSLNLTFPDNKMTIKPIDAMRINADGRIASMRAFWSDEDVTFG